jgi:hypothetical protein
VAIIIIAIFGTFIDLKERIMYMYIHSDRNLGLIPLEIENLYISTPRAQRLADYETMASIAAGILTHLYLRSFFGGSGAACLCYM